MVFAPAPNRSALVKHGLIFLVLLSAGAGAYYLYLTAMIRHGLHFFPDRTAPWFHRIVDASALWAYTPFLLVPLCLFLALKGRPRLGHGLMLAQIALYAAYGPFLDGLYTFAAPVEP